MKQLEGGNFYTFNRNGGQVRFVDGSSSHGVGTSDIDVLDVLIDRAEIRFSATGLEEDGNVLETLKIGRKVMSLVHDGKKIDEVQKELSFVADSEVSDEEMRDAGDLACATPEAISEAATPEATAEDGESH